MYTVTKSRAEASKKREFFIPKDNRGKTDKQQANWTRRANPAKVVENVANPRQNPSQEPI
jgi:hypothetical protein